MVAMDGLGSFLTINWRPCTPAEAQKEVQILQVIHVVNLQCVHYA